MSRRLLAVALAAAFITGTAVGLIGGILFARHLGPRPFPRHAGPPHAMFPPGSLGERMQMMPDGPPERMVRRLARELELTDSQLERVRAHITAGRQSARAARESLHAAIGRELTPAQQQRLDRMLRHRHHPGEDRVRD
jgi:hypothetical protein